MSASLLCRLGRNPAFIFPQRCQMIIVPIPPEYQNSKMWIDARSIDGPVELIRELRADVVGRVLRPIADRKSGLSYLYSKRGNDALLIGVMVSEHSIHGPRIDLTLQQVVQNSLIMHCEPSGRISPRQPGPTSLYTVYSLMARD